MFFGEIMALSGAFAIGSGTILSRFLTFKLQPVPIQAFRGLIGGIILILIVVLMGDAAKYAQIPPHLLALSLLAGIAGITVGDALYVKILSLAPASKVCPVLWSVRILLVSIGGAIFYQEAITWFVALAAVLIMVGVYLALSSEEAPESRTGAKPSVAKKWIPLCLLTGGLWASYYLVIKLVLTEVEPLIVNSLNSTVASIILCLFLVASGRGESLKIHRYGLRNVGLLCANGILVYVIGMVLELYAIDLAGAARTAILVSWAPIFVLLLSGLFLKEKITWRLIAGTLLCTGGTILLVAF